ncbi:MAG TPA: hypothetical protein VGC19_00850 [Rhodanobacter sp.]
MKNALAEFVDRPQIVHQIGDICLNSKDKSIAVYTAIHKIAKYALTMFKVAVFA